MSRARGAAALVSLVLASLVASAQPLAFDPIPLRVTGQLSDSPAPLRVRVEVLGPERLVENLSGKAQVRDGAAELALPDGLTLSGKPEERYRAASFVIDWNERPIQSLHADLVAAHGAEPSLEDLRAFTDGAIPRKRFANEIFASTVAREGAGDSSEHALLLAALARSVGRPARMVFGVLLVSSGEQVGAWSHQWVEIHDGGAWRIADATPPPASGHRRYLPLFALEDEGPNAMLSMRENVQSLTVSAIEVRGAP